MTLKMGTLTWESSDLAACAMNRIGEEGMYILLTFLRNSSSGLRDLWVLSGLLLEYSKVTRVEV
jgi:hypothetical protein